MKWRSTLKAGIERFFPRRVRRRLAAVMLFVLALQTLLFALAYNAALEHLKRHDPRRLQNRSEISFYFAPVTLRVGATLRREDLVLYLRELGYVERAEDTPASFFIHDDEIAIRPRLAGFTSATLAFTREGLSRIVAGGSVLEQIELEPLPMQNFVRYLNDESLAAQRVRRTVITAEQVPEMLADALTSAEDRRFFSHHGIDVYGIAYRVITRTGGGSSITQQLVKNTIYKGAREEFWHNCLGFLPASWQRKATDVFLALATEKLLSKGDILAAYLSVVPLGAVEGVELQGAVVAAREFFGKGLTELSLAEAATLAGMIHKPSFYLSRARQGDHNDLRVRRNHILDLMRRNLPEKYSAATIAEAKAEPLQFVFADSRRAERPAAVYSRQFVEFAAKHLPQELSRLQADEGATQVFTTLDFNLQKEGTKIAEEAAQKLQTKIARVCRQRAAHGDSGRTECANLKPQVALIALDARTGAVLALVGGVNTEFNHATAKRSPASAIKPFYYLRAIERGAWRGQPFTAATLIDPDNDSLKNFRSGENAGMKSNARVGLSRSYNFHAVAAGEAARLESSVDFVGRLTDSKPEQTGMAAIGGAAGSEVSLLKLTQAYTIFPNNGRLVAASFHQSFMRDGVRTELTPAAAQTVADAGAAFIVTRMLEDVLTAKGTAPQFRRQAGLPSNAAAAGKTGTGMLADVWFVVFTPRLIVGVWCGLAQNEFQLKLTDGFSGGHTAAPIAATLMQSVRRHRPELLGGKFAQPDGVKKIRINSRAGCVAASGDSEEFFLIGREPPSCGEN